MGPLVDVVREAVAPGLQELGRSPGVVDLVEVHLARLGQPEGAQEHRRDDEDDEEPQVDPIETAATLGSQRGAAVRPDGRLAQACLEPAEDTDLRVGGARRPGRERRNRRRARGTGRSSRGAPVIVCRRRGRLTNHRIRRRGVAHNAGGELKRLVMRQCARLLGCQALRQTVARPGTKLGECPQEDRAIDQRDDRDARFGPDQRSDAKPVADSRIRVERVCQDRVHVQQHRHGQDEIGHSPAPGDDREHDRQREHRVRVALVDAGGNEVERQGEQGQTEEDREAVRAPRGHERDDDRHDQHQQAPDQDRRDGAEERDSRAALVGPPRTVADPQSGVGEAVARVTCHEGPRVEGVNGQVGIAGGRCEDLGEQAGLQVRRLWAELQDGEPERQAQQDGREQGHEAGRDDPVWVVRAALPGEETGPDALERGRLGLDRDHRIADGPEGAADRHQREDRDEDPELRLDQGGDHREDRGPFGSIAPQCSQREQQEDDAHRIDLAPDDAVEPADGVHDGDECSAERQTAAATQLQDHRPHQPADGQIGEDRRDLDEVADAAHDASDDADQPQDVQVAGRVVVEEISLVEARWAVRREVVRPEPERAQIHSESRPRQQVCDDESKGETEGEDHEDRADGSLRPGQPRRRSCALLGPT